MSERSGFGGGFIVAMTIVAVFAGGGSCSRDDSDGPEHRSGMAVHVDHKTGCEYLSRPAALIARVDASGRHICRGDGR